MTVPDPPTPVSPPRAARRVRHTLRFLIAYYALGVVWGIRGIVSGANSPLDLLVPVALAIALAWWAIVDARRRRHPIPLLSQTWFYQLPFVLVPGYVVWSRRWKGVGWVALHTLLWFVLVFVVMIVVGLIVAVYGELGVRKAPGPQARGLSPLTIAAVHSPSGVPLP